MKSISTIAVLAFAISGCASIPPISTNYYAAKTALNVRIVRTVGCDKVNYPIVASTVTATTTHSADFTSPLTLSLTDIDGPLANSDIKFEYYPDGRMKGVNATTTGQGETILKSAVSLIGAAFADSGDKPNFVNDCKHLKRHFGETPLSLAFEVEEDFSLDRAKAVLKPDIQSAHYYNKFKNLIGETCMLVGSEATAAKPVELDSTRGSFALVGARQPAFVPISIAVGPVGACETSTIWSGYIPVGQFGTNYTIPIPKAAVFGKQVFAATFDEAGSLTMLQYAKDGGEAGALAVVQSAYDTVNRTDEERAKQLKEEADVIAAQQRLIKCQTVPDTCS